PAVKFSDQVNKAATLTVIRSGERVPIHGFISHFEQRGRAGDKFGYRAIMVPRAWSLSLNYRTRIWGQNMTVEEIVTTALKEAGFSPGDDFKFSLSASYPKRDYCVQFKETDLDFFQRTLEHEGIFYFFEHGDTDVLHIADNKSAIASIDGESEIVYNPGSGLLPGKESIGEFICREHVVTGKIRLKDYNYRTPDTVLKSESQINTDMPGVRYEYGPHINDQSQGDKLAKVRNEEIECQRRVMHGDGDCPAFRVGNTFTLDGHYRSDLDGDYFITSVRHSGSQRSSLPGLGEAGGGHPYQNEFSCIPADVDFRPKRITAVPQVPGVMTSVTETAGGDYAFIDENGEYHLKMHFDLTAETNGEATKAIRKAQPYTGPEYGMHFPEHANTEMIWACVNGDPDRPMALLTAPHPSQKSPSTADNKAQNVIRTWGKNELTFDDTIDDENIYLHATKNRTTKVVNSHVENVGNNQQMYVGHDRTRVVKNDETTTVENDQEHTVGNNRTRAVGTDEKISIGSNQTIAVGTNRKESVGSNETVSIGADRECSVGGNQSTSVSSNESLDVGSNMSVSIGSNLTETVGGDASTEVGSDFDLKVGKDGTIEIGNKTVIDSGSDLTIKGGKKAVIEIADQLTLKCGKAKFILKKNGDIEISGKKINIKGSGDIKIKGSKVAAN
ncbi:MAG: type VI secretion system tip protein VgrG, partial [Rhodothermales bacterium]|nr:type VI secretion system tip protein VgrG [Rhodothermales bacterium]